MILPKNFRRVKALLQGLPLFLAAVALNGQTLTGKTYYWDIDRMK